MPAAVSEWLEYETPETRTGTNRWFIGNFPPNGFLTRNDTDDHEEQVAIIAVRDRRKQAAMIADYEAKGYQCVACSPDVWTVSREAYWSFHRRFTVVTDDLDLVLNLRLKEGSATDSVPIHAVIEDGEILEEARASSFGADEVVPTHLPPKAFESLLDRPSH